MEIEREEISLWGLNLYLCEIISVGTTKRSETMDAIPPEIILLIISKRILHDDISTGTLIHLISTSFP
jgi:hypothetical protein